jgi:hypothetical protein
MQAQPKRGGKDFKKGPWKGGQKDFRRDNMG